MGRSRAYILHSPPQTHAVFLHVRAGDDHSHGARRAGTGRDGGGV